MKNLMRTANITWQPIYCIRAGHIVSTIGVVHSLASVWAVALRNRLRKILSRGFDSASGRNYRDVHCLSEVSLFIILSRVSLSVLSVCLSVSSKYYGREDVATTTTSHQYHYQSSVPLPVISTTTSHQYHYQSRLPLPVIIRTFVTRAVSANKLNLRRRQSLGEEDGGSEV